jgi:NADP-dependent 3-hydroxy acid dehydrogenase YdfG
MQSLSVAAAAWAKRLRLDWQRRAQRSSWPAAVWPSSTKSPPKPRVPSLPNCMHYALPLMRPHKTGLVINISSTSGKRAAPLGGVAYNASKFAMAALGTSANEDERENGIRVTTIFPGEVDTPILSKRPVPPSAEHRAKILKPADIADITVAIAKLPPLAHVPELVIKPIGQSFI